MLRPAKNVHLSILPKKGRTFWQTIIKRFLIADDHYIVRTGVSILLQEEFLNAAIDFCSDGDAVTKMMEGGEYDLVILDISMPGLDSISLLKNIFTLQPAQRILILSM